MKTPSTGVSPLLGRLGLSTHCFVNFDAAVHLPLMAAQGLTLLDLGADVYRALQDDRTFRPLQRALADNGFRINAIHAPFSGVFPEGGLVDLSHPDRETREKCLRAVELCAERALALNGRCVVLHPSCDPVEERERAARRAFAMESLAELTTRFGNDRRVRIAIENLPRGNLGRDADEMLAMLADLDPRLFGVCLDVNHANFREDVLEATRKLAPRTITTHISDNDGKAERHSMPGTGVLPWGSWAGALLDAGYEGPFIYEIGHPKGWDHARVFAEIARNARDTLFAGRS